MNNNNNPVNLFLTKHFLGVAGMFYLTILSPAIDKWADGTLTKKDTINLLNGAVVAIVTASLKGFDGNVYTPKGIVGRNKEDILEAINNPIINTVQSVKSIDSAIQTPSINTISNALQTINNTTNEVEPIKDVSTIANTVLNPVGTAISLINNPVNTVQSNILDPINNLFGINNNKDLEIPFDSPKTSLLLTTKQDTYFKLEPVDSATLDNTKKAKVEGNKQLYINDYAVDTTTNHISFNIGDRVFYAFIPHITLLKDGTQVNFNGGLSNNFRPTIKQCNELYDTVLTNEEYTDLINCLNTFNINTKLDVAHFLSQCGHESGGLRYIKEIGDYDYFSKNYDYRDDLGNDQPGDGAKYAGTDPLQMTGKANYQAFADYIGDQRVMEGVDYVSTNYLFGPSGFWWFNNKMSSYINDEEATIEQVSTAVNGSDPANGLQDRQLYFSLCKEIFNIV